MCWGEERKEQRETEERKQTWIKLLQHKAPLRTPLHQTQQYNDPNQHTPFNKTLKY